MGVIGWFVAGALAAPLFGALVTPMAEARLAPISTALPVYPPQTRTGGAVLAVLTVSAGTVTGVGILDGDDPFTDSARSALRLWRFPGGLRPTKVPVVVVYASPRLLSSEPPGVH